LRRNSFLLLCVLAGACGRPARPPAAPLFPISTAWTATLDQPVDGPAAVCGPRVVLHTRDGTLHALEHSGGRVAWRQPIGQGIVGGGEAILCLRRTDGLVIGLDPATGAERWRTPTPVEGDLPPVVAAGRVLLAGTGAAALDAASGAIVWSVAGATTATAAPAAIGPCVVLAEGDVIRCRDAATGRSRWEHRARGTVTSPAVTDGDGRVLVGTAGREFLALDLDDGDRQWRWKVGADVIWPAVVWRDLVIFATHENVLYGLKRGGGNMAWRAGLPSRPLAPPVLVGNDVLVACYGARPEENVLVGYAAESGERLGDLRTTGELAATPAAVPGRLLLPLRDRRVVALALPEPPATPRDP
jgi:outer membrane protein assembly factor BamB